MTQFHEDLLPDACGELVLVVDPVDPLAFDGLSGEVTSHGITARFIDTVPDVSGTEDVVAPELVFVIPADAVDFHSGARIRLYPGSVPTGTPFRILGLAADYEHQQLGDGSVELDTRDRPLQFRGGEEVTTTLALACFCNGGRGCRPVDEPVDCTPGSEGFCNDGLNNDDGDTLIDCADPDCWSGDWCAGCGDEDCTTSANENCDGYPNVQAGQGGCGDWQCASTLLCRDARPEICVGDEDEDLDGSIDCLDTDCSHSPGCLGCSSQNPEVCDNLRDDDCDALIDCWDEECADAQPTEELRCDDGFDDDCDGLADCFDLDCLVAANCECPIGGGEICFDGFDSDCDGKSDCDDHEDCDGERAEEHGSLCSDGIDNNCFNGFDCQDSTCLFEAGAGRLTEVCGDGRDNDCDELADCADDDCIAGGGVAENCFDFIDNDCDDRVDCADDDCQLGPENCWNFRDDNCNGSWDCSDPGCADVGVCEGLIPENCQNHVDDDGDAWIDCSDEDCLGVPACL